jgi:transcriptional regulator of acetoin/glycerol metabolism
MAGNEMICPEDLPEEITKTKNGCVRTTEVSNQETNLVSEYSMKEIEKTTLIQALREAEINIGDAAALLNMQKYIIQKNEKKLY